MTKVIKEYKSGHLYDTTLSKYITRAEVKAMIDNNQDFKIVNVDNACITDRITREINSKPLYNRDYDELIIKRYPNRKLYSYNTAEYITLKDIVDLIKEDVPFKIVDDQGNDIENGILKRALSSLNLETSLLKELIKNA